jgi:regulatory protein
MPKQTPSLKGRALRLLSAREYSRSELLAKLARYEEEDGSLVRILDELEVKGFISEQRVVESVLHRRATKVGLVRIRQELLAKGVNPQSVVQAVNDLRSTELQRAQAVWRKKFGTPPADAKERAKQARFLATRGFTGDTIARVVIGCDEC